MVFLKNSDCIVVYLLLISLSTYVSLIKNKNVFTVRNALIKSDRFNLNTFMNYDSNNEDYVINLFETKRRSVVYIGGYVPLFNALGIDLDVTSISQSGSGFIWDNEHIVTNYHVVKSINPSNLYVTIIDSSNNNNNTIQRNIIKVSLRGYDEDRDIAVLKIDRDKKDKYNE